ncbi:MAG: TIGR03000 domain-containing protein [Planctomycetales bacterium]|nr:TIGR03000 domain-containing protein [Planctomycetales bacterium]
MSHCPSLRSKILAAGLLACLIPAGTLAQPAVKNTAQPADRDTPQEDRKTVLVEVYLPEDARLFFEGQEMKGKGEMRRYLSPPLPPGKYTYTIKAIIPSPKGPRTVTHRIDVRPGDFESIDLREPGKRPIADVEYEPTPQKVVDALLRLAKVTDKDVLWDLGCGDGRIPVTAAKEYGCKASGFDIDPQLVKESLESVRKHGVARLVTIEQKDIFKLDLSKGPTIVTVYLLPRLNAQLLPQLRKLPPGARVISVAHRMADIKPDEQIAVDTELGNFNIYLWKVETLQRDAKTSR